MTTETSTTMPDIEPATDSPVARSGDDLRAHRELLKLSVNDVSQRLKLQPRQVAALESDDWAALPGTAFIRGALRSYAKNLGIDVTPMLETIGGHAKPADLQNSATLDTPMPRPGGGFDFHAEGAHRSWLLWAVLGVAGVIALTLFFGRDGDLTKVKSWIGTDQAKAGADGSSTAGVSSKPGDRGSSPAGTVTEVLTPGSGAASSAGSGVSGSSPAGKTAVAGGDSGKGAADTDKGAAKTSSASAGGAASGTSGVGTSAAGVLASTASGGTAAGNSSGAGGSSGSPAASSTTGASATATAASAAKPGTKPESSALLPEEQLHFTFAQTAWLQVKQIDGKVLYAGYGKVKEPRTVTVRPPVKITVGNVNQVQFQYHGAEYDMRPFAIDNVARFTLKE